MKQMKKALPRDLAAYCRRRVLVRVIPCVLLIALLVTAVLLWGDLLFGGQLSREASAVCIFLSALIPMLACGVPLKLLDRTWRGRIERIDVQSELASEKGLSRPRYREQLVFLLTVRTDDGRVIHRRGLTTTRKIEHRMDTYHVGDGVFHLYGTAHVVVFPTAAESTLICPVCGVLNDLSRTNCMDCAHTLVKE